MNIHKVIILAVMLIAMGLSGCATQPMDSPEPIMFKGVNKTRAMTVAENVLKDMRFTIEKADADNGFIKTKPLRGAQFFEFWRRDNASAAGAAESNIQSLQRTVELNIAEGNSTILIDCQVSVRRLSLPENDHVGQSRSAALFTESSHSLQRLQINFEQAQQMEWVELGSDPAMETRILGLIQKRISRAEG